MFVSYHPYVYNVIPNIVYKTYLLSYTFLITTHRILIQVSKYYKTKQNKTNTHTETVLSKCKSNLVYLYLKRPTIYNI